MKILSRRSLPAVFVLLLLASACKGSSTSVIPTPFQHKPGSDCTKCHGTAHGEWAMSLHAATPTDVLLNKAHDTEELLVDECIQCHAPFQASTYHVGDFVRPLDQKGPWHLVAANVSEWQAIRCEVCHDVTSAAPHMLAFYDPTTQTYDTVAPTDLCEKCHQAGTDDSRDLAGSVHQGLTCIACHLRNGMNIDARNACSSCHPKVDPPGHPAITDLHTSFDPASPYNVHFITCKICHNPIPAAK